MTAEAAELKALSPLDGRYARRVEPFAQVFCEQSLIKHRFIVEVEWFIALAARPDIPELSNLSPAQVAELRRWAHEFGPADAGAVKAVEAKINHDVKAVEYYFKERLRGAGFSSAQAEFAHFACTSEDINNLAYALMLRQGLEGAWTPLARQLVGRAGALATEYAGVAMLSHTHGQPATPTTLGKELAVFAHRWRRQLRSLEGVELLGKFNGAVGTYGAHVAAYPDVPWVQVSRDFVESFGLTWNALTTQVEQHDFLAEVFHALVRFNSVLTDFSHDMWAYISMSYLRQKLRPGEVGSSTMPHKVNPIDFENAEANAKMSSALLNHLAEKLPVSRLQRDLSDSSSLRNVGVAMAYSGLAITSALAGLARVEASAQDIEADLAGQWGVLAEAVQTVMRRYGLDQPYERLKALTRGAQVTEEGLKQFVRELGLPADAEKSLLALSPATYTGLAEQLALLAEVER